MINIFQLADNDQSVYYLGQVFGNVGFALTGGGPALLSMMFKVFNTALLSFGALIVTYTTVVGVFATAQEGEFLGRKWHALWVPLRTVGGIAALFPTKTGYCAIQVIVMWMIVQGVGAADMVWKTAVDYVGNQGAIQTPPPTDFMGTVPNIVQRVFSQTVCQAAVTKFHANSRNAFGRSQLSQDGSQYTFGRPNDPGESLAASECGAVAWQGVNFGERAAQTEAMQTMVPVLEILANYYVNQIIDNPDCWQPCTQPGMCRYFGKYDVFDPKGSCPTRTEGNVLGAKIAWSDMLNYAGSNFMLDAVKLYSGYAYNYAVKAAMAVQPQISGTGGATTNISNLKDPALVRAQANGWIFAGAFYYYIANQNNGVLAGFTDFITTIQLTTEEELVKRFTTDSNIYPDFAVSTYENRPIQQIFCGSPINQDTKACPTSQGIPGSALGVGVLAINAMNASVQAGGGITVVSPGSNSALSSEGAGPMGKLTSATGNIIQSWAQRIAPQNSTTNPLISIQNFGESLLIGAEVLFWTMFGVFIALGLASTMVFVLGNGNANPFTGVADMLTKYVLPLVMFIMIYLIIVGGSLGVYTPLIPYIFFTFGAIGWFLAVVDAMVAAPIMALGILSPGGQHEILGRADPSVMILLNVCLRPTLMVIGMMAAMLLSYVVINFINAAFFNVVSSIVNGNIGVIEGLLFVFAYVALIVTALNKCFSLIYLLADQVLRWIGGHAESFGEKAAEGAASEAKGKVAGGGKFVGKAGGKALGATGQLAGAHQKAIDKASANKQGGGDEAGLSSSPGPANPPGGPGDGKAS